MFCEDLTQEEVFEAYLLYNCLHGLRIEEETLREQVSDYCERSLPDARIDEALLAYLEDRILAPPDVVLDRWGSSRFYELLETEGDVRHRTCETWFQNGCTLPAESHHGDEAEDPATIVHFWTEVLIEAGRQSIVTECLREGTRVSIMLREEESHIVHRQHGEIGQLPAGLHRQLKTPGMSRRKFLCLIDKNPLRQRDNQLFCSMLVVTSSSTTPLQEIVEYAVKAFDAPRTKC